MDLSKPTDNWRCPDCGVLISKRCSVYRHVNKWCKGNDYAGVNGANKRRVSMQLAAKCLFKEKPATFKYSQTTNQKMTSFTLT